MFRHVSSCFVMFHHVSSCFIRFHHVSYCFIMFHKVSSRFIYQLCHVLSLSLPFCIFILKPFRAWLGGTRFKDQVCTNWPRSSGRLMRRISRLAGDGSCEHCCTTKLFLVSCHCRCQAGPRVADCGASAARFAFGNSTRHGRNHPWTFAEGSALASVASRYLQMTQGFGCLDDFRCTSSACPVRARASRKLVLPIHMSLVSGSSACAWRIWASLWRSA